MVTSLQITRVSGTLPSLVPLEPLIEDVLGAWREALGSDLPGYRGHVYRTFNFACALAGSPRVARELAIASAFHDIGIWADSTFDYLVPSALRAANYVRQRQPSLDAGAIERVVLLHHKLTSCRAEEGLAAEAFRRADLVDLSFGLVGFGLPRSYVREVRATFPNAGFHRCLLRVASRWVLRHPTRPFPMLRW